MLRGGGGGSALVAVWALEAWLGGWFHGWRRGVVGDCDVGKGLKTLRCDDSILVSYPSG